MGGTSSEADDHRDYERKYRFKVGLTSLRLERRVKNARLNLAMGQNATSYSDGNTNNETCAKVELCDVNR